MGTVTISEARRRSGRRARHNVVNAGEEPLKLDTLYAPPGHRDKVVHRDKEQAERDHDDDHWDGGTSE